MKNYIQKICIFVSIFFVSIIFSPTAHAETVISENLQGAHTWTLEGSPYIVETYINMWNEGDSLTIEPGVEVYFALPDGGLENWRNGNGMSIGDNAFLIANGTEEEPIVFASLESRGKKLEQEYCSKETPCWRSLTLGSNENTSLSHAKIYHAYSALSLGGTYREYEGLDIGYVNHAVYMQRRSGGHFIRTKISNVDWVFARYMKKDRLEVEKFSWFFILHKKTKSGVEAGGCLCL